MGLASTSALPGDRGTAVTGMPSGPEMPMVGSRGSLLDSRRLAAVLLAIFAVVFFVQAAPRLDAPFGDSHDGENGATWGLASRAIRDDGFLGSRAGGQLAGGGGIYAHHPPFIAIETAVVETVAGEHPASTRAPAWIGSLVSIALLYMLLRALGIRRVPSAIGVVLGLSCPMFLFYGSMLDTLQISLPLVLGFLILRARADTEQCREREWPTFGLAMLVVVSSWEGALLCATFTAVDLYRGWRRTHGVRPSPTTWGFLAGASTVAAWLWWTTGSFGPIFEQAQARSGTSSQTVGWLNFLDLQGSYLDALIGPALLVAGAAGLILVLRDRRTRVVVACTGAVIVAYPSFLREAAAIHGYWNYWLLIPLAIGIGGAVQSLVVWFAARYGSELHGLPVVLTACVAVLVVGVAVGAPARHRFDVGVSAVRVAQRMIIDNPTGPTYIMAGADVNWADYSLQPHPRQLRTSTQLEHEAMLHPDAPVLVKCGEVPAPLEICPKAAPDYYVVVKLSRFASRAR